MTEFEKPISVRLRDIIADFLDVPPSELTPDRMLDDFNVDSLDFIEILFLIEDQTALDLPGDPAELRRQIHCLADIYRIAEECEAARRAAGGGGQTGTPTPAAVTSQKPETET
jgi:acyl carrier protein